MPTLRPRLAGCTALAAAVLVTGAAAPCHAVTSGAANQLYERTVMTAADARCRLFTPDIAAALEASRAQARGAALRAGSDPVELAQVQTRARQKAAAFACTSSDIRTAAGRVRTAFDGYARMYRMEFPGDVAGWRAERVTPVQAPAWTLSQSTRFGADRATLGLTALQGSPRQLAAAVVFADGARPYSARLVVRDGARTSGPYLGDVRGPSARIPLKSRTAPRTSVRAYAAEARTLDVRLSPEPGRSAEVFRFPAAAIDALAGLDPREAVSLEFVFGGRSGDVVRTAYFEVGDFQAARSFIAVARR